MKAVKERLFRQNLAHEQRKEDYPPPSSMHGIRLLAMGAVGFLSGVY